MVKWWGICPQSKCSFSRFLNSFMVKYELIVNRLKARFSRFLNSFMVKFKRRKEWFILVLAAF